MSVFAHRLRWAEIDPATHPFDSSRLEPLVERALAPFAFPGDTGAERERAEEAVTRALAAEYGAWVMLWTWAASEPGGGGPVRSWCCAQHSFDVDRDVARERVVTAVLEWRTVLERLHTEFAGLHVECAALGNREAAMRGAARLLPLVIEWTGGGDAWHGTLADMLSWFLEPTLSDRDRTNAAISEAISGVFSSWTVPDDAQQREAVSAIGRALPVDAGQAATPADALAQWRTTRTWMQWITVSASPRHRDPVDGHLAFIESIDRQRDPLRASRMEEALALARASAARDEDLTVERITGWQKIVLGRSDVAFRRAEAFAKQGFFHPFEDGNGRAARLVLDFVLARAGLGLYAAAPVFMTARLANDWAGAYRMQAVVESVLCPLPAA